MWILFNLFILSLLLVDLLIFHFKSHVISFKEALWESLFWIGLAFFFNIFLFFFQGKEAALNFFTGYLIEKSLSIDNLFVFILIFQIFKTPAAYIHKTLFWGVLGAIILRGVFIALGISIISHFHEIIYLFGLFLIYTGITFLFQKKHTSPSQKNILYLGVTRIFRYFFPITDHYEGDKFFLRKKKVLHATPLFLTLIAIECADVVFALDSIPAIFAITLDPFIVYTSNIFAILGLRSLYFVLHNLISYFRYLHYGIALILIFIGLKMVLSALFAIPIVLTLGIIFIIISMSMILSILVVKKK